MSSKSIATTFYIQISNDFCFEPTVRSFGFYALAPNRFDKETKTFCRPLCANEKVIQVEINCLKRTSDIGTEELQESIEECKYLRVKCITENFNAADEAEIRNQVKRMFRLDLDISNFHNIFPKAKQIGFGRSFRSPQLFEDFIKTFTNLNTTFSNTKMMNTLLCEHVGSERAFPTVQQLAKISEKELSEKCKVGYRADRIIRFAREVRDGKIDLNWFEKASKVEDSSVLKEKLLEIHGFGEFAANNMLQLLGKFDTIPADSETARYLRERHSQNLNSKNPKKVSKKAQEIFGKYAPYQFLVYWFELYNYYDRFKFNMNLVEIEGNGSSSATVATIVKEKAKSTTISNKRKCIEIDSCTRITRSKSRRINAQPI